MQKNSLPNRKEARMQIEIKGRNVPVPDDLRRHAERRLEKVSRQVSEFARLEIELLREPNPRVADHQVAEATLYLKGVTLRARDASPQMMHSLNLVVDELARQVKRYRDRRRRRRQTRAALAEHASLIGAPPTPGIPPAPAVP
jgi:putative sigma-54 modulation protein